MKYDSQTQCFIDLQWLPIREKIIHKILTLVIYNMLYHKSPAYLQDLIVRYQQPTPGLGSENSCKSLEVPRTKQKTFAERSFLVAGPKLWNSLLEYLKKSEDMDTFKHKLKTYLFR